MMRGRRWRREGARQFLAWWLAGGGVGRGGGGGGFGSSGFGGGAWLSSWLNTRLGCWMHCALEQGLGWLGNRLLSVIPFAPTINADGELEWEALGLLRDFFQRSTEVIGEFFDRRWFPDLKLQSHMIGDIRRLLAECMSSGNIDCSDWANLLHVYIGGYYRPNLGRYQLLSVGKRLFSAGFRILSVVDAGKDAYQRINLCSARCG